MHKQCEFCNTTFVPEKRSDQKYCSYDCGKKMWDKKQSEKARKEAKDCTCQHCGKIFKPRRRLGGEKYCSKQCKSDFHKEARLLKNKQDNHKPRVCRHCKYEYLPEWGKNATRQQFCTDECKANYHKLQDSLRRKKKRANTIKVCPICNKEFSPEKTMKQIYCTRKCANSINRRVYHMMSYCYSMTNSTKADHTHEILGYSPIQLLEHLQTFPQWDTLRKQKWHLDHKFPIIAFVRKGVTDISLICKLDNLQPLAGTTNCSKNDTYDKEAFEEWLKTNL